MHIIGLGDYTVTSVTPLQDPCPITQQLSSTPQQHSQPLNLDNANNILNKSTKKLRTLKQKERVIYAPHCNLGFLNFEKSGGYISIPDDYVVFSKKDRPDVMMEHEDSSGSSGEEQKEGEEEEEEVEEGVQMVRDL